MHEWIDSQALFIQIACGIVGVLVALGMLALALGALISGVPGMISFFEWIESLLLSETSALSRDEDHGSPIDATDRELITALLENYPGKTREQLERYREGMTRETFLAAVNTPAIRFIIKRNRREPVIRWSDHWESDAR